MTSAAEIIEARRARVVQVVDARGRTIGVRRIRPSEQLRAVEMADHDAERSALLCAAAVTFIEQDGWRKTIPGDAGEGVLWSLADALGPDGLAAVAYAVWQHAAGPAGGTPSFDPFRPLTTLAPTVSHAARVVGQNAPDLPNLPPLPIQLGPLPFAADSIRPSFHKL